MLRDLHTSLKTQPLSSLEGNGFAMQLAKLQWSKNEVAYTLHVRANTFTLSGLQTTDLLGYLGFERTRCPFLHGDAYCIEVPEEFQLSGFPQALDSSHKLLCEAERHLNACGLRLPQPEGFAHFFGKAGARHNHGSVDYYSDGHSSHKVDSLKQSEDEQFNFAFTWITDDAAKGWTTHYRPKHFPVSAELSAMFELLSLNSFESCPEFDFETCYWDFNPSAGDSRPFSGNAESAHQYFEALPKHFSLGLEKLSAAHATVEKFGLGFLPLEKSATVRQDEEIQHRVSKATSRPDSNVLTSDFDVAISFAGTSRSDAEQLATIVRAAGFNVFYDDFYPDQLWGKNLVELFDAIYRKQSKFCVIFVSHDYISRQWTNHERQSAQARALIEKGNDYILPIQVDGAELPGMAPTVGYVSLEQHSISAIAGMLINKIQKSS